MVRVFVCIMLILILPGIANSQFFDNALVKTRPLQDFIGYNPNIGIEKNIGVKYTIEVDLMYRNRKWYSNGGEMNFGEFMPSSGYRLMGGARKYISKKKEAPYGWFIGSQFVISYAGLKDVAMREFHGEYNSTQDIKIFRSEFVPVLGYQFHISKRISSEFYLGSSFWLYYSEKTIIVDSDNSNEIGKNEAYEMPFFEVIMPVFSWSIGFAIN